MRLLYRIIFCASIALGHRSYDGYKVYSIQLQTVNQLQSLIDLSYTDTWDTPNMANKPFRVMVDPDSIESFERFLGDHHISSKIIIENAEAVLSQELSRNAAVPKRRKMSTRSTQSFDHFYNLEEIEDFLQEIAADHPDLITVQSAGKSSEGRDLWLAKISNSGFDGSKPVIFMDANIHAREWITVMSTLNLIHELVDHAGEHPEMLAVDWMILPMSNPDGYYYSHNGDRMWRKSRSVNEGSSCLGADPNRNYPYKWELAIMTSDAPCSLHFRGRQPESEPETAIIANLLRDNKERIKLYLAIHSYGDWLMFPWGYDYNIPNDNTDNLQSLGDRVSRAINLVNPERVYVAGNSASTLYPCSGASDDFAVGECGISFAYTVELSGGGSVGFDLEPEKIQSVSNEIFAGYREYATWVGETF